MQGKQARRGETEMRQHRSLSEQEEPPGTAEGTSAVTTALAGWAERRGPDAHGEGTALPRKSPGTAWVGASPASGLSKSKRQKTQRWHRIPKHHHSLSLLIFQAASRHKGRKRVLLKLTRNTYQDTPVTHTQGHPRVHGGALIRVSCCQAAPI